ncbi:MAG: transglutaminase-like domain-containing protein [Oscillospiraceae bacterium]|nr:transglutaminase-like domain-containing protein [Oscillospiraceae bacterium]
MILQQQIDDIAYYLKTSDVIDFGYQHSHEIIDLSNGIKANSESEIDYIKKTFEYVRDSISHSADIRGSVVTCRASDVLKAKEGICYAKSHLLAAMLRCVQIPTGFCYQRLILNDESSPHLVLHGLNAVYISSLAKWIRLDARGNKHGVNAQFSLEQEQLAFTVRTEKGEEDIPIIFANPDGNVVRALTESKNLDALWTNLPAELSRAV